MNSLNGFAQIFRTLGPVKLAAIGGMLIVLVAFFSFLSSRISTSDMGLLYGDLDTADSAQIVRRLESMDVPYKIQGDGSQIWAPSDQVAKLRLNMAEEGLPTGGSVGYELFDKPDTFGTSTFMQSLNHVRALEGELARTIATISSVRGARVHIVMPKREPFSREKPTPTASVVLNMGSGRLDKQQIKAVQHLIAAAVPGMHPTQVSIIDNRGTLLAKGFEDGESRGSAEGAEERNVAFNERMARMLEGILEPSVGVGKVRAEVSATLNFDRVSTQEEKFDPDSKVVRSTQTVEESDKSTQSDGASGAVGVQSNLPDPSGGGGGNKSNNNNVSKTEEMVNYEISKVVKNQLIEAGGVKRLSVAVLVDGNYDTAADGKKTYKPRTEEQMKKLESLVRSAIGFEADRGDTVEIVNMQFVDPPSLPEADKSVINMYGKEIINLSEKVILALLGLLVLLMVVRPLINRFFEASKSGQGGMIYSSIEGPNGETIALPPTTANTAVPALTNESDEHEEKINLEQVEGKVKASSLRSLGTLVEKHPQETATVIRNWLHQE